MSNLKSQFITDSLKRFGYLRDEYGNHILMDEAWDKHRVINDFLTQELSLAMEKIEDSKEFGKGCMECGGPVMALCNKCSIKSLSQTTI